MGNADWSIMCWENKLSNFRIHKKKKKEDNQTIIDFKIKQKLKLRSVVSEYPYQLSLSLWLIVVHKLFNTQYKPKCKLI